MKHALYLSLVLAASLAACGRQEVTTTASQEMPAVVLPTVPQPPAVTDDGERIYKQICKACHETGVMNAPKVGNPAAWAKFLAEGQAIVTAHGWVGVRGMPPRGGRADLPLEDFARAAAWMARSAGGDWPNPDAAMLAAIRAEEAKRIEELSKRP